MVSYYLHSMKHGPCKGGFQPSCSVTCSAQRRASGGGRSSSRLATMMSGTWLEMTNFHRNSSFMFQRPSKLMRFELSVCTVPAHRCGDRATSQHVGSTASMSSFDLQARHQIKLHPCPPLTLPHPMIGALFSARRLHMAHGHRPVSASSEAAGGGTPVGRRLLCASEGAQPQG